MINTSLLENIHDQTTLTCGKEMEVRDESGHDNTKEVGRAWMERYAIAHNYDVAADVARIDITDPEVTSDGFDMDLMMTRGSDPAEGKSSRS